MIGRAPGGGLSEAAKETRRSDLKNKKKNVITLGGFATKTGGREVSNSLKNVNANYLEGTGERPGRRVPGGSNKAEQKMGVPSFQGASRKSE